MNRHKIYLLQSTSDSHKSFTDIFEFDGDLIAHYKIYIDISPLLAD